VAGPSGERNDENHHGRLREPGDQAQGGQPNHARDRPIGTERRALPPGEGAVSGAAPSGCSGRALAYPANTDPVHSAGCYAIMARPPRACWPNQAACRSMALAR
jgi:hypothetical protein